MSRGVRGGLIFKDDFDYKFFIEIIKLCQDAYNFKVHSYCLMSNHFHMEIETKEISISKIMERMLKMYANNFNRKYNYIGHVFQGSYKGIIIDNPAYFLETSRYIHLNPVKAGMVRKADEYKYSSFDSYVNAKDDEVLFKDKVLGFFRDSSPFEYEKFVDSKANHEKYEQNIKENLGEDDNWLPW